jgi:hypothetical protein
MTLASRAPHLRSGNCITTEGVAMRATRPLSVMIWLLGYAAIPAWPAGVAAAIWWTGRAELLLLALAGMGTSSAMALTGRQRADARMAERDAQAAEEAARHERVEGVLCEVITADLRGRAATTPPGLPGLRALS